MMKEEFEKLVGKTVAEDEYKIIEYVYNWHPDIKNVGGKEQMAKLYVEFGMVTIRGMMEVAEIMDRLDTEELLLTKKLNAIRSRINHVKTTGDVTEERCRKEVEAAFESSENEAEYEKRLGMLRGKYGVDMVEVATNETYR